MWNQAVRFSLQTVGKVRFVFSSSLWAVFCLQSLGGCTVLSLSCLNCQIWLACPPGRPELRLHQEPARVLLCGGGLCPCLTKCLPKVLSAFQGLLFIKPYLCHQEVARSHRGLGLETSGSSVSLAGHVPAVPWLLTCDMGMALMSPPYPAELPLQQLLELSSPEASCSHHCFSCLF